MGSPTACLQPSQSARVVVERLRLAFVGPRVWLDGCAPPAPTRSFALGRFTSEAGSGEHDERALDEMRAFVPHACFVFDPGSLSTALMEQLPGRTLGILVTGDAAAAQADAEGAAQRLAPLDRLVSFAPALTGATIGGKRVWRAMPAPVSDLFYRPVGALRSPVRGIAVGRSTRHREHMLLPAKHHHDLLQVLHGVSGGALAELLEGCDVGVHVAAQGEHGYGQQVGLHLAAGQLLLSEPIVPAHGLEVDIDYLRFDSPEGLVWMLDRLGSFPQMHQRVRVRGRMKAEQYRASRVFTRLAHDLLADVAAFG